MKMSQKEVWKEQDNNVVFFDIDRADKPEQWNQQQPVPLFMHASEREMNQK